MCVVDGAPTLAVAAEAAGVADVVCGEPLGLSSGSVPETGSPAADHTTWARRRKHGRCANRHTTRMRRNPHNTRMQHAACSMQHAACFNPPRRFFCL